MSSRFPDLFVPAKAGEVVKTWMVQVNTLGDAVVYRLDDRGQPSDMACGPIVDTVLDSLACACPNVVVHMLHDPDDPRCYDFQVDTWAELLDVLAGRSRTSYRSTARRLWDYQATAKYTPLRRYVAGYSWQYSNLQLTDKARAADDRMLAKQAEQREWRDRRIAERQAKRAAGEGGNMLASTEVGPDGP